MLGKATEGTGSSIVFKASLSSSLINGIISEDDYKWMKAEYTKEILKIEKNMESTALDIRNIVVYRSERVKWLKDMRGLTVRARLDRAIIVRLIKSICVKAKGTLR